MLNQTPNVPELALTPHCNTTAARVRATVTVVTATQPARLAKLYRLGQGGRLDKVDAGAMRQGQAAVKTVADLTEFAQLLQTLGKDQALAYGRPELDECELVTDAEWRQAGCPDNVLTRTRKHWTWPAGAGVMFGDYDPDGQALSRDELHQALCDAVPALAGVQALWWVSGSSHLHNASTGERLQGQRGQRLYWLVADATDIPRAGAALQLYLWAAGFGSIKLTRAGVKLDRTLLDAAVWQPERLDFAAGAATVAPVEQRRGVPELIGGTAPVLDTRVAIPEPTEQVIAAAQSARKKARDAADPEAAAVRAAYVDMKSLEIAGDDADDDRLARCRQTVERALGDGVLAGDIQVIVLARGREYPVPVRELLGDPERWHGHLTLDPLEPEYDGRRAVGKLYLIGGRPNLYSQAHGGRNYTLIRAPQRIELTRGRTVDAVESTVRALAKSPDMYDFGGLLATTESGAVHVLDEHALRHMLASRIQYWAWRKTPHGVPFKTLEDPPAAVVKGVMSPLVHRGVRPLTGVITAPTMTAEGRVIDRPGYDEATGLLLEATADGFFRVPARPSLADAQAAVGRLLTPFRKFPLVGGVDRGVLLAALLSAAVRPTLENCPAFGFDAPVQGSGKSLLAKCVATLATGLDPSIYPHTHGRDDEETRKRILSILMTGTRAVIIDNVIGNFDSAALAALLTAGAVFTDRILGKSVSVNAPNRALWVVTGNNLSLAGDLPRRVLKCRIDPNHERPFAREFEFCPLDYVRRHRQRLVVAALTVVRAWLVSGATRAAGRTASFEGWDDTVRQAVAWIAREHEDTHLESDYLADPMQAMTTAAAEDPEHLNLTELLEALHARFGRETFTARAVADIHCRHFSPHGAATGADPRDSALAEAIDAFAGRGKLTARSVGMILRFRADRVADGRALRQKMSRGGVAGWQVTAL
jgi:hypothetical protein